MVKLSIQDVILALAFAMAGFAFTTQGFVSFWASLSPLAGLLFNTALFFILILVFGKLDLIVLKLNFGKLDRLIGMALVTLCIYLVFGWSSCYFTTNAWTGGGLVQSNATSCTDPPSFDGVTYGIVTSLAPPSSPFLVGVGRLVTYVLLPFLLALLAGALLHKQPEVQTI